MRPDIRHYAWIAAILVPLAYLYFYTPYGMDTTDFGYFYGYGWRILQGQMPYRDFSYIKPALPLYWHAMWMWLTPQKWQILAGKAGFVMTVLTSAWFCSLYLKKFFNLGKLGVPLPLLATCGFVFGIHTFPHMPWHTADGILFSAASLFLAASGWPTAAGILAACAMLCKQSFLFVPVAIALMIWFCSPRKQLVRFALGACGMMCLAIGWISFNGAWHNFRAMTTGQLDWREALDAGILIYLRQNWLIPAGAFLPFALWQAARKACRSCPQLPFWLWPAYCYLAILAIWYIYNAHIQQTWIGFGASWPTFFMLLGACCILWPQKLLCNFFVGSPCGIRGSIVLGAALTAAWSVAISGGYKIPAMFATPLVFSFLLFHASMGGNAGRLAWATLFAGLLMFGIGYQYPYVFPVRPLTSKELVHDAGKVYSRASGVFVDADMLARLAELKDLRARYGANYKTLPGFTLAYFLNGDYPCYGSDWLIDWEINGQVEKLYQELLDKKLLVFMERDQADSDRADGYERAGYGVPQKVRREWKIIEETPHFIVFAPPAHPY